MKKGSTHMQTLIWGYLYSRAHGNHGVVKRLL